MRVWGALRKIVSPAWAAIGLVGLLFGAIVVLGTGDQPARAQARPDATHLGVATCGGTTCHGRPEGDGAVVRQDEIARWQAESGQAGAHSRAWRVLGGARGRAIAAKLGIGDPQASRECLGCHADPGVARGPRFHLSDGVGCEACHGGGGGAWLASHYATGATHQRNIVQGLFPIDAPLARAQKCLDCHLGGSGEGQYATHRIMAAGHPRLSFELDLFSVLEQHWNEDADYARRKGRASGAQMWAVGQAMAVERAIGLYRGPRGTMGALPEFGFFDCHSCHRRIADAADYRPGAPANAARGLPPGYPPFQDANMVMLSAAAKVAAPLQGERFDAAARAFHQAFAASPAEVASAGARLRVAAQGLGEALARHPFSAAETFAMAGAVATRAAERATDYEGGAQAVMALDTLLSSLVRDGAVSQARAAGVRGSLDVAYRTVRDPNAFVPGDFRVAIQRAGAAVGALR